MQTIWRPGLGHTRPINRLGQFDFVSALPGLISSFVTAGASFEIAHQAAIHAAQAKRDAQAAQERLTAAQAAQTAATQAATAEAQAAAAGSPGQIMGVDSTTFYVAGALGLGAVILAVVALR